MKPCMHAEVCDTCDVEPEDCGYYEPAIDREGLLELADEMDADGRILGTTTPPEAHSGGLPGRDAPHAGREHRHGAHGPALRHRL